MGETTDPVDALLHAALDLTRSVSSEQRYQQLLDSVQTVVPSDAAALLRLTDDGLHPLAVRGLSPDVLGRTFDPDEHPRLQAILNSRTPVVFQTDDPRPDPYDGLVSGVDEDELHVHSCMGCSLWVGQTLVGALTLDSLEPGQFDGVDRRLVSAFSALAAAALQTAELIESLEESARRRSEVARDLVADALRRQGGMLIGGSAAMAAVRREIDVVAQSDLTVLITGETGTGKELVARTVHASSPRADQPLVYVNCAALPETIAESELFGHVRGAFTGATNNRAGKFELADQGTLFLDEIGELPLTIQAKLLRALQFGEIQRVGTETMRHVDVRIVAATNRDLEAEVAADRFRADLFHRLSVYPIDVPPLRERDGDVALLAGHFLDRARIKMGTGTIRIRPAALAALAAYPWPGNVRELDHVVTRAALRAAARTTNADICITSELLDLDEPYAAAAGPADPGNAAREEPAPQRLILDLEGFSLNDAVDEFKRELIERTVASNDGNWSAAARELDVDRGNLYRTAKRLGLK